MANLTTPGQVFEALGGLSKTARLLSQSLRKAYTPQRLFHWKGMGHIPDRETFPAIFRALQEVGYTADPAIWGFSRSDYETIVETANALSDFYSELSGQKISSQTPGSSGSNMRRRRTRDLSCRRAIAAPDQQMQMHL